MIEAAKLRVIGLAELHEPDLAEPHVRRHQAKLLPRIEVLVSPHRIRLDLGQDRGGHGRRAIVLLKNALQAWERQSSHAAGLQRAAYLDQEAKGLLLLQ